MLRLDSPVQFVKGVGPRRSALLAARAIRTIGDLLLHIPKSYQDRASFSPLASLTPGQDAAVQGKIYRSRTIQTRTRGRILDVIVTDGTSFAHAKWFHGGYLQQARSFTAGRQMILYGRVERDSYDSKLVFFNPEFEFADETDAASSLDIGRIVPIYEEIAGLTSRQLRRIMWSALSDLENPIADPLPESIREQHRFPALRPCLDRVHFPQSEDILDDLNRRQAPCQLRLIFEEFFMLELALALKRKQVRVADGVQFETNERIRASVKRILPFHPTAAQKRVLKEIVDDLKAPYPMNRLLQGDVGSGKTLVAFQSIVVAVENGYQACIMAPTEILADQHYLNSRRMLAPLNYTVDIVRRGLRKAEKQEVLERIADGSTQVIIGTHILIEESVVFRRLGLVVIDEQHRFGVVQRLQLMSKGEKPNTLVMTATPIPRTLAMTLYGDLDVSVIDELPPGRSPIRTVHVFERNSARVYEEMARRLAEGRQCYVVYPLIEESEKIDLRSATEGFEKLSRIFSERKVALLHGRLRNEEKDALMRSFTAGQIDVLVSTTVIEVGVDVANATLMLIQHAERFGLAQLHQLRGRVGRGSHASTCILMTSEKLSDAARERIHAMTSTTDGFKLAEVDLHLRGPGEMAGTRQSGVPEFRVASLFEDAAMLAAAQQDARVFADGDNDAERVLAMSAATGGRARAGLATVG